MCLKKLKKVRHRNNEPQNKYIGERGNGSEVKIRIVFGILNIIDTLKNINFL